jgi:light-regulated signal transduction histidine kinase (bacteriophytochrome)
VNAERLRAERDGARAELVQFTRIAAHDLKGPLQTMSTLIQLFAARQQGRLDARDQDLLDQVVSAASHMSHMIDGLLRYSRIASAGVSCRRVDLEPIAQAAVTQLEFQIRAAGAEVRCGTLRKVWGDPALLQQVFEQLIENALKFKSARPLRIEIDAERKADEWIVTVRDNGIGIEPQHFERIFELFQRLHTNEEIPGVGVGLAICRKILDSHGGRIWVESKAEQGATFRFALPANGVKAAYP